MEIKYTVHRLNLTHSFGISRSTHDWYDVVFVFLKDGDIVGRGEAAPSKRYNESTERIISILNKGMILPSGSFDREQLWNMLQHQLDGIRSLEAAVNMAIWDWWGQKLGCHTHELLSVDGENMPKTSFTIAIGDMAEIPEKISEADPYDILKVKLGTPDQDKQIMIKIRELTDKLIRVDANEGWDPDTALEMCKWLADRNVEFVEQPFPADQIGNTAELRQKSPLPLYADENSLNSADIPLIAHAFDGINIKLMKCGSIEEGKRMIDLARKHDMKIMLGCMVESSIGITAAAQLAGEVDAVDLDGNLLIDNDPYAGVRVKDGRLVLPKGHGSGLSLISNEENLL